MTAQLPDILKHLAYISLEKSSTRFGGKQPGLDLLVIKHPRCHASLALQGAQLLSFQARDQAPLLWLSPKATFLKGKAVRGGIPICAPWFGPHSSDPSKPQHGFARNALWTLTRAEEKDEELSLTLQLDSDADQLELFPWPLRMTLTLTLSDKIEIAFSAQHLGDQSHGAMPFSWALHSYFPTTDIQATYVSGLDETQYFDGEVDRLITGVPATQLIHNRNEPDHQTIKITGRACPSAIIWNPGAEKAEKMADLGQAHCRHFVCVERGAAGADSLLIAPGEMITGQMTICHTDSEP